MVDLASTLFCCLEMFISLLFNLVLICVPADRLFLITRGVCAPSFMFPYGLTALWLPSGRHTVVEFWYDYYTHIITGLESCRVISLYLRWIWCLTKRQACSRLLCAYEFVLHFWAQYKWLALLLLLVWPVLVLKKGVLAAFWTSFRWPLNGSQGNLITFTP